VRCEFKTTALHGRHLISPFLVSLFPQAVHNIEDKRPHEYNCEHLSETPRHFVPHDERFITELQINDIIEALRPHADIKGNF
jgi:hypothetical protein